MERKAIEGGLFSKSVVCPVNKVPILIYSFSTLLEDKPGAQKTI